jgi:murein DD-endopeptidase MepM/ murein hydrolase activator NlpD
VRAERRASRLSRSRRWLALASLVVVAGRARAADVDHGIRDVSTLTARAAVLTEQASAARVAARWRARALYQLVVAGDGLSGVARARAIDAGTRALARELAEARSLAAERDQLGVLRGALSTVARADEAIGGAPPFALPVAGPVLGRFGVSTDRATGIVVPWAGLRLAAAPRGAVRAPAAGTVALVAAEAGSTAVVLDHAAGWTTIVTGLDAVAVAAGAELEKGAPLGTARPGTAGAPAVVTFEVWRGRHPVDPLLLVRSSATALAAPARLP